MKTKIFLLALLCGMTFSVTSCKDDDNNEPSAEEQEQQAQELAEQDNVRYAILDNLADMSNVGDDFLAGNYEPTIGQADDSERGTRIVTTGTMAAAAAYFADLVDADVNETTPSYTWTDEKMGTLTYTKSQDGRSWATVDVSLTQVPHLQKIVYRSAEQGGDNAAIPGTAYYHFGDVVVKQNADKKDEYWICVSPAFGPEGKTETHWVTLSALPKKNVWHYKGSNGLQYAMPTKLGDNKLQAQNFAELLYAICYPEEWQKNLTDNASLPMFGDFDKKNIDYHNRYFWERTQKAWADPNLVRYAPQGNVISALFGREADLSFLQRMVSSSDGLNLLTHGYSWITKGFGATNSPTLYRSRFVNGQGAQSNMHQLVDADPKTGYEKVKAEVIKAYVQLNVDNDYPSSFGWVVPKYFGSYASHYVIRHATGAQLASDGKEKFQEPLKGVTDVYNYNKYYNISVNDNPEKLQSIESSYFKTRGYYMIGDVVRDENRARWFCVQPSTFGDLTNITKVNYAYFVSYDSEAVGLSLENIPQSKELAAQMLYNLCTWYNKFAGVARKQANTNEKRIMNNVREHTEVSWLDLFAQRDTLFHTTKDGDQHITCNFGSTIYRDANGQLRVLRLINDGTKEETSGDRAWAYSFWDCYTADPQQPMMLTDMGDSVMVSKYADDQWVYLPWFNPLTGATITAYTGMRDADILDNTDPFSYIYSPVNNELYSIANPFINKNMYREPLIPFAVKRVADTGNRGSAFEDGTKFTEVSVAKDYIGYPFDTDDGDFVYGFALNMLLHYENCLNRGRCTLNGGERFGFTLSNQP